MKYLKGVFPAMAYTFMAADVQQFVPVMWNDHTPEPYRKTEHLDKDLADRAIDWIIRLVSFRGSLAHQSPGFWLSLLSKSS